ncbi:MAG: hypothetical protein AMXMBFR34_10330 [Myxococcaceae bacterium]
MGLLRFVIWTGLCVAFGVWLGTAKVGGKSPLQQLSAAWSAPKVEEVKRDAKELVTDVKKKVTAPEAAGPKEQHTAQDKAAIDDIIARRPAKN